MGSTTNIKAAPVHDGSVPAKAAQKVDSMSESVRLDLLRNIGIIAHIDAGKTTVTERILYLTGRTHRVGEVDDGTTVMDWMELEQERGITITAAATRCSWDGYWLNLIDTPGHVDFTAEVERSLRVLDGGVVVFDGVAGVEPQSETVWRQADKYNVPRICFVNKMDRPGADLNRTVSMIESRLCCKPVILQCPWGEAKTMRGVIDLVDNKALEFPGDLSAPPIVSEIPDEYVGEAKRYQQSLIENLAENDEELMEVYLEDRVPTPLEIISALRRATLARKVVPVLCGSALRNIGVQQLIDAIIRYLPSPLDVPPIEGIDPKTNQNASRLTDPREPFSALVFKVVTDVFVGRLVYLRVYSGNAKAGAGVFNSTKTQKERLGRLLLMHANRREEITEVNAGGIVAALGLKNSYTGDTLCDPAHQILLEAIKFPQTVISAAIEPRTKADQDKITDALTKLAEEDPTFKVRYDTETGQTIISGMGELHIDVLTERLKRDFKVEAKLGKPQVAYKEAITQRVKSEGRFIKQYGGRGQYGHVWLELEPGEKGSGFQFVDRIKEGAIPKAFIPAVESGIREALDTGVLGGYPVVDIKVSVYDGSYHQVDSSEVAFRMAGSIAVKEGMRKAGPVMLEPIMRLDVITPEEFLGDILGDLKMRRARIESTDPQNGYWVVTSYVPLGEVFGYATSVRSLSQGRATYSMEFYEYEQVPSSLADQLHHGGMSR